MLSLSQSRHICRIVDTRDGLHAGTVVLVSDRGEAFGYALTCWHNFDPRRRLHVTEDTQLEGVFLTPSTDPVDAAGRRRPALLAAKWSNAEMDVAVLKIPRAVITEFDLQPMSLTFDLWRGMRLTVAGFQRPGELRRADVVRVQVVAVDHALSAGAHHSAQRVFEVTSLERRAVPFDPGMSGGAMIAASGALVGLSVAVAPDESGSHRSRGYGVSIETIARSWPLIAEYCQVRRARPWARWLRNVAGALIFGAALAAAISMAWPHVASRAIDIGRPPPDTQTMSVHRWYVPSGKMGDIGDVTIAKGGGDEGGDRFIYQTTGTGPHEWEYKHNPGAAADVPAQFAGVMYLSPPGCWGATSECGYDLRQFRRLHWEARSANALMPNVEFFVGTDNKSWRHTNGLWEWTLVPFPGATSYPWGTQTLSSTWRTFDVVLDASHDRRRMIGGFGWLMTWGANGVGVPDGTPAKTKTFVIDIRNIRYER